MALSFSNAIVKKGASMSPLKSDSSFNISVFDMNGQRVCNGKAVSCVCLLLLCEKHGGKKMRVADAGWKGMVG